MGVVEFWDGLRDGVGCAYGGVGRRLLDVGLEDVVGGGILGWAGRVMEMKVCRGIMGGRKTVRGPG